MATQVPSIGRVVHVQGPEDDPIPAVITAVNIDGSIDVAELEPTDFNLKESSDGKPKTGCWNWPPFVPPKP